MSADPDDAGLLHLAVTVELGADPITGTVHDGTEPGVDFTGWLELMSAFETLTGRAAIPAEVKGDDQRSAM